MNSSKFYTVIILCTLVTWIPRIFPFIFAKFIKFPEWLLRFLRYLPLAMMTALFAENFFVVHPNQLPGINLLALLASIPAVVLGWLTRSLVLVVVIGVVSMGLLRFFF
ncbi:AzlD domain-containing protein [Liquorilactobacillus uvarum]|uniref:AzlD domain-containing protein n=1 Tax=Liquorilactobacillus uvarum TaxID=303240 RepID=UPI00288A5538|nr:AzlD domain-containing protein [Liquorilactobacillus uvarum]